MRKILRILGLLFASFLMVIAINEGSRLYLPKSRHTISGIRTLNHGRAMPNLCSWKCHNDTEYCKKHHTKILKSYMRFIDPIYDGIVQSLGRTGNYQWANIIFLVVIWPLMMCTLFVKVWSLYLKIKANEHF